MSTDKENEENRPLADMSNAAADLNLTSAGPWRFDLRDRSPMAVTAVAEFAEMLCVVDPRFGDALPVNWMRLPYIVALMDALRCACVWSFIENRQVSLYGRERYPFQLPSSFLQSVLSATEPVCLDPAKGRDDRMFVGC